MPASVSAFEFAHDEWPSAPPRKMGRSVETASSSALFGLACGNRLRFHPAPISQPEPGLSLLHSPTFVVIASTDSRSRQVALRELDAAVHRMHVRVVETRQHHLPFQIDVHAAAVRARDFCVGPERHDAMAVDRDRLHLRLRRVHRVDRAIAQDQFDVLPRRTTARGEDRQDKRTYT